jgi:hypothetical protein
MDLTMSQVSVRVPRTAEDIALGAQLAKMQNRPIGPADVARVLKEAGMKYVIVGAHAANGYTGRPRATVSRYRRLPDKKQDAVDFIRMIEANQTIDRAYSGGGEEILKLADDARAGRQPQF